MSISQLQYELQEGYVHNWLVAGPQVIPVTDIGSSSSNDLHLQITKKYYQNRSGITKDPIERGPITEGLFTIGAYEGSWSYLRCREDHFIDHSARYQRLSFLRSWAFTQLVCEEAQEVVLVLTTNGPADAWLNGHHIHRHEHFQSPHPGNVEFNVSLKSRQNKLLIRFENVSKDECPDVLALRVCQASDADSSGQRMPASGVHIEIPTLIEAPERRNELEESFQTVYMRRDVFTREHKIEICWPEDLEKDTFCDVRMQSINGPTYAQAEVNGTPGDVLFLGHSIQLATGQYKAFLMPRTWEYYDHDIRIQEEIPFWVTGNKQFSTSPYGSYPERLQEALIHAMNVEGNLYAEIAKVALKRWDDIVPGVVESAIGHVNDRTPESPLILAGLLRMQAGFSNQPKFLRGLKDRIKECILGFRYWSDEPGIDLMVFEGESDSILFHACEILAGQKYPGLQFRNNDQLGRWHQKHGETFSLEWLQEKCHRGFNDWDSDLSFEKELVALSLLADFAKDDQIGSLAIVAMDKILFSLALNSYQGVLGSSQGRGNPDAIKGGYLQATSGITRLKWGMGIFNQQIAGLVSLALSKNYQTPEIIAEIGRSTPEALLSREKHSLNSLAGQRAANLAAYRTPDGMLASALEYFPGERGAAEHVWQATLGPGATVFVNHPANSSGADHIKPNFWLGNKVLPRVGQWKDTLIAVYCLPADDWMGFTHAYFPTFAFDEYALRNNWAFARKGNGYLALTASNGITLTRRGREALRELRSSGRENIWVCLMGRAALDKDFSTFQEKVLMTDLIYNELSIRMTSLRGDKITFGWEGPMVLNGDVLSLESNVHYDSLFGTADFPASQLDIRYGDDILRLDFGSRVEGGDLS